MSTQKAEGPRGGGGREKTQPTPTELLPHERDPKDMPGDYLLDLAHQLHCRVVHGGTQGPFLDKLNAEILRRMSATTLSAREDGQAWFPLLGTPFAVRWSLLNEQQAKTNHYQTLSQLAQRQGLSPAEAAANVGTRAFKDIAMREAFEALIAAAPKAPTAGEGDTERCESGDPECGPVEFHDSEGVPLCRVCWEGLLIDSATEDES